MSTQDQPEAGSQEPPAKDTTANDGSGGTAPKGAAAQTERSVQMLALAGDLSARNMEAMMSIARIALTGMDTLAKEALVQARQSSDQAVETLQALADAKTPSELLSVQSAYLKSRGQTLLTQAERTRRITDATGRAIMEKCSTHATETVVGYTRIVRG
jgi:hypothetical protein